MTRMRSLSLVSRSPVFHSRGWIPATLMMACVMVPFVALAAPTHPFAKSDAPKIAPRTAAIGKSAAGKVPSDVPSLPGDSGSQPIEVTADESLEWRKDEGVYVARGRAKAVQGNISIAADLLTASMKNKAGQKQDRIVLLTAAGNVEVESNGYKAKGGNGSFDAEAGLGVLTGPGLQLTSDEMTVTAHNSLEYWQSKRLAVARGAAEMIRSDGTHIKADELVAQMREPSGAVHKQSGLDIKQVDARGRVRISMPQGTAQCDRASFDPVRNLTQLFGHVRVVRGTTVLVGDVVEMNMATGVSRLVSKGGERVRVFLVPGGTDGKAGKSDTGIESLMAPIPGRKSSTQE